MITSNEKIICKEYKGMEYIQFKKLLDMGIKHAYTLKGVNTNFRSDSKEEKECYSKIYEAIGLDVNTLVKPLQKHTSNVKCIDKVYPRGAFPNTDGLITDKPNIALTTTNADCILFMFYDPVKKVIANVHSGWKGTFQKIAEKAVVKMITNYKCNPENIYCFISPSIRKCHFEVDEDVKNIFENTFSYMNINDKIIEKGEVKEGKQKYFIDTNLINRTMLEEIGLLKENIIESNICTVCNKDVLHSYRVDREKAGRNTAIIALI